MTNAPINYTFTRDGLTINVIGYKGRIRESILSTERELSYSHFKASCSSNPDLLLCYAQARLASYIREGA
jgi:hypothetical protein